MKSIFGWSFGGHLGLQLVFLALFLISVSAQGCSKDNPCATGCCSKHGYCGTGDEFCGADCVDTCDYKLECDANNPCASGCCNKFGFCGLGPDYCGDDCVAGCESKSECDPGFGTEWSEGSSCPLSVCCSKFGFCGTTEEFCGKKKVTRPSCPKSNDLKRVVGYYETWSTRRRCNQFWPERIPLGVYTHIIIAFAVVDPDTFEIRPAATADIDLYKRVAYLKNYDPDLKVYIAVGGWTYNDPGATATTFSDLAASEDKQKVFFKSLIKFLSTYNLDGIDFDWEYPVADDRSGRPEDFKNFPKLLKNLKAALKSTGGRDGLSITLPASYWYLQHFDIRSIVKHVDFFNIMSYDLHGTWDEGNEWLGEYLNAHTNLTEITTALDLLWRNDISAEKVVLGLAFYGRAFTVEDSSCMEPGCLFASGAEAGDCSNEVGILMNSEISKIVDDKSLKPKLYKEEAVKIVSWDDQWVAYDDGDTWKIKADFARGQCLGGVMVWAISHDTPDGHFSRDLASVVGRKFKALPAHMEEDDSYTVKNEQCKWTNCGEDCPAGWTLMRRNDPGAREGEWMFDDQGCHIKDQYHRLCCPPSKVNPVCGWWTHNNGRCVGKCPTGMFEIGSNSNYCSGAFGNYQAACCTTGTKSVALYETCVWGEPFDCDAYTCPADMSNITALSCNGNGGSHCGGDWRTGKNEKRKFCCDTQDTDMRWDDCTWEQDYVSSGALQVDQKGGKPPCISNCPADKVRVAMEHDDVCKGKIGSRARCCSPNYTTKKENPLKVQWESDLKKWMETPSCKAAPDELSRRGTDEYISETTAVDRFSLTRKLQARQSHDVIIPGTHNHGPQVLTTIIFAYQSGISSAMATMAQNVWNSVVATEYTHLATNLLLMVLDDILRDLNATSAVNLASDILCNLKYWNQLVRSCTLDEFDDLVCENLDLEKWDPEYGVDPDTYGTSMDPAMARRDNSYALHVLDKRDGSARTFTVDCGVDPVTGLRRTMVITSQSYPNGNNGDDLQRANGLTVRFALANINDCFDTTIDANAPNNVWTWVTEHVLELQMIPRSIEFMVTGIIPAVHGLPQHSAQNTPLPWDVASWLTSDYQTWANGLTTLKGSPIDRIFNAVGSKDNPKDLVNCEYNLNSMKGRIFYGYQPVGDPEWRKMLSPETDAAEVALHEIRMVIAVFVYLNHVDVNSRMTSSYHGVITEWRNFDTVVAKKRGGNVPTFRTANLWREFMRSFMTRLTSWVGNWASRRLDELQAVWTEVLQVAPNTATEDVAHAVLGEIAIMRRRLAEVRYDTSMFELL